MSMEMSRLVKEGIAVNTFHWLKDKENKMYHRQELEEMKLLGTFDTEKDLLALDPEKFWNNTWN
jgi:hypothetical protein